MISGRTEPPIQSPSVYAITLKCPCNNQHDVGKLMASQELIQEGLCGNHEKTQECEKLETSETDKLWQIKSQK